VRTNQGSATTLISEPSDEMTSDTSNAVSGRLARMNTGHGGTPITEPGSLVG
jgi:hypothetical protein